jgi:hypothetical protein
MTQAFLMSNAMEHSEMYGATVPQIVSRTITVGLRLTVFRPHHKQYNDHSLSRALEEADISVNGSVFRQLLTLCSQSRPNRDGCDDCVDHRRTSSPSS